MLVLSTPLPSSGTACQPSIIGYRPAFIAALTWLSRRFRKAGLV